MLRVSSVLLLSMISFISLSSETFARPAKSVTLSSSVSSLKMCSSNNLNSYMNYIKKYNKQYNTSEFWTRYNIYLKNMEYITYHNKYSNKSYSLGVNSFTDWSRSEFEQTYLSNKYTPNRNYEHQNQHHQKTQGLPVSVDWRAKGWVTNVKNQQQCGSCWAFSAVGAMEGQHANATGNLVSLSEQNLVDCSGAYGCYGCNGGWPEASMRYVIHNHGIDTEVSYPYTGMDGTCNYNGTNSGATFHKTVNITSGDMNALYHAIAYVGPISVAIDAEGDFQFYNNGIFNSTSCSKTELDHAVLAVGYGVTEDGHKFIMVKNSWGADWGMDGYIYFSADQPNLCGIATDASYPLV